MKLGVWIERSHVCWCLHQAGVRTSGHHKYMRVSGAVPLVMCLDLFSFGRGVWLTAERLKMLEPASVAIGIVLFVTIGTLGSCAVGAGVSLLLHGRELMMEELKLKNSAAGVESMQQLEVMQQLITETHELIRTLKDKIIETHELIRLLTNNSRENDELIRPLKNKTKATDDLSRSVDNKILPSQEQQDLPTHPLEHHPLCPPQPTSGHRCCVLVIQGVVKRITCCITI